MELKDLQMVANATPVRRKNGMDFEKCPGGLATANGSLMLQVGGKWIGTVGVHIEDDPRIWQPPLNKIQTTLPYEIIPVVSLEEMYRGYYGKFANGLLWWGFHARHREDEIHKHVDYDAARYHGDYVSMQELFAGKVEQHFDRDRSVIVNDYHLVHLAEILGDRWDCRFFLHIPFPCVSVFQKMPHARTLLSSMLKYRRIGFQCEQFLQNFEDAVRVMLKRGPDNGQTIVSPIGLDTGEIESLDPEAIEEAAGHWKKVIGKQRAIVAVNRLDPTKRLPEQVQEFGLLLERHKRFRGEVKLILVADTSRMDLPGYREERLKLECAVQTVNDVYGRPGYQPVHVSIERRSRTDVYGLYTAGDVHLCTPRSDGMNLGPLEFAAAKRDQGGVMVISSKHVGAGALFRSSALLVNQEDPDEVIEAIQQALEMSKAEQAKLSSSAWKTVQENDIFHWAQRLLA